MSTDPVKDLGKAELVPLHRASDEAVSIESFNLDVRRLRVGDGQSNAFVNVEE